MKNLKYVMLIALCSMTFCHDEAENVEWNNASMSAATEGNASLDLSL